MEEDLKKTARMVGVYSLGALLNRAVSFIMLPVYTRVLTPTDYGVMELLDVTVDVASIFLGVGIMQGLVKFYYDAPDLASRRRLVSTLYGMVLLLYGAGCGLGLALSGPIARLVFGAAANPGYVALAFINLFLTFLLYVPLTVLRTEQRAGAFVVANLVKLVLQLGLNILFVVVLGWGVRGVLLSTLVSSLLVGGVLAWDLFRRSGFGFSGATARRLVLYGYPFVASGLGAFVLTYSDRYFLNHYGTTADVGLYGLAYRFGFLLMFFPVSPFNHAWLVQRFEAIRGPDPARLFNDVLVWFMLITMTVALAIALTVGDVLRIVAAPAFWSAASVVPVLLLAYVLQGLTDFFNFGIYHSGRTAHMAYGTLAAALAIVGFSLVLIPRYGMAGAAWATLLCFGVRLAYVYFASQRLFRVEYALRPAALVLAAAVGAYLFHAMAVRYLTGPGTLGSVLSAAVAFAGFGGILIWGGVLDAGRRRLLAEGVRAPQRVLARVLGR